MKKWAGVSPLQKMVLLFLMIPDSDKWIFCDIPIGRIGKAMNSEIQIHKKNIEVLRRLLKTILNGK
jgi:hypothetical protein